VSGTSPGTAAEGNFVAARCGFCEREVLTYPIGDPAAPEARRCIHCDERVGGELRCVDAADFAALGYDVDSGETPGGGCTSCSTGGCATRDVIDKMGVR
jgi:hypothetical protein